ncbi:MAG: hypothetical protein WD969_00770 [Paracoccaceae bacterium]
MQELLIFVALEDEFPRALTGHEVIYTGVGKVNAALAAAQALIARRPALVVNYGTAGAVRPGVSGLIECGAAAQRDMDLRPLGLPLGVTFGDTAPALLRWAEGPVVGTGDSFASAAPEIACDLVDMEAYALAKAAARFETSFRCMKYVTDAADESAASDWAFNKAKGAELFAAWLARL